jgi:hypothetical protein
LSRDYKYEVDWIIQLSSSCDIIIYIKVAMKYLLFLCICVSLAIAAKKSDLITNLPGLVSLLFCNLIVQNYDPGFTQYAGYITVDEVNGRALFYWFVESQSDPTTDPLVVWFQVQLSKLLIISIGPRCEICRDSLATL